MSGAVPSPSPFQGLIPFDETNADVFFGRVYETQAVLNRLLDKQSRTVTLTGEVGVGKTSLVRAGVIPALTKRGIQILYVGDPTDLDTEILRAATRAGFGPASPVESTPDYMTRVISGSRGGLMLIFDHLETIFRQDARAPLAAMSALIASVVEAAGPRVRILLVANEAGLGRLGRITFPPGFEPTSPVLVERLDQGTLTEILDSTTLHSGLVLEPGLSAALAGDLCRTGLCLPLDLQVCARALIDSRLTSLRKWESLGGAAALRALYFESATGGPSAIAARRVLQDVSENGRATTTEITARTNLADDEIREGLRHMVSAGLLVRRPGDTEDVFELIHPGLASFVDAFVIQDRARTEKIRRQLRLRLGQRDRGRLTVRELYAVKTTQGLALSEAEQTLFARSLRRVLIQAGIATALILALVIMLFVDARQAYVLAFDPPRAGAVARVVVRTGRPRQGLARWLPGASTTGDLIADTGFSAAGLAAPTAARIADGQAGGTLDPSSSVPSWLRDVVNGLRPVPRGVAKALMGDPDGVTSLKQAFSDPLARREALDSLAVIGRGRAGEDEILAAALGDAAPEIRRRGVEVASEIDRHLGTGAHVTTLRNALNDKSLDVRHAVLREVGSLPPAEATEILAVALRDHDPTFRRAVEETMMTFAAHHPEAAAAAAQQVLESPDGNARHSGMALLELIATQAPAACSRVLEAVVMNPRAAEEARVSALLVLRKAGAPAPTLKPLLEQAATQTTSPRLRAAALPLYARLIDASQAEELARSEMKGSPAARVTGAAIWAAVAATHPELAMKPLKGLVYDPSAEVRTEAARGFAFLKREGISLCEKALRDPSIEVERAAVESLLVLAPINPNEVANILGKSIKLVRPGVRRQIVEALGHMGLTRPAAALPPLAHALKDSDVGTRAAVATAFCGLARINAVAASPYLRIAARDDARDVRTAAASCVEELATGDPKGGAKMAMELASAEEPTVRAAATESLGRLATRAPELALSSLLKLLEDGDAAVRAAAVKGLLGFGESGAGGPGFAESKRGAEAEHALIAAFALGDIAARQNIVAAAAKNRLAGVLRQATTDADESVRLKAVRAAGAFTPPAFDVVRGAVDDRAPTVRAEATRILAATSGPGAKEVLPIYEAALRGGDHAAREAAIAGLGELPGAGDAAAKLLGDALTQRSESIRAAAARALGRLAEKNPDAAVPVLERALHDAAYDVANAAIPGLALAWSRQRSPDALADIMLHSETDSARRFVALEALVLRAQATKRAPTADDPPVTSLPPKVDGANGGASADAGGLGGSVGKAPVATSAPQPASDRATKDEAGNAAITALIRVADSGPPLARLAAQLGRAFASTPSAKLHPFLERLLGG